MAIGACFTSEGGRYDAVKATPKDQQGQHHP